MSKSKKLVCYSNRDLSGKYVDIKLVNFKDLSKSICFRIAIIQKNRQFEFAQN